VIINPPAAQRLTVTRQEAAAMLGIGLSTIDALIKSGALHSIKLERRVLIPVETVEHFLRGGTGRDARR
jgi:excisionase family DNA binding protein